MRLRKRDLIELHICKAFRKSVGRTAWSAVLRVNHEILSVMPAEDSIGQGGVGSWAMNELQFKLRASQARTFGHEYEVKHGVWCVVTVSEVSYRDCVAWGRK